ncbi:hypothetical protein NX059_003884 [Plenodomus lindquistii]|nr:hypothetical protein NX059_003884 [Plenodomus lindquistii]
MAFATEAARWRALVTRDASANDQFIYSVKSTNIYCRPTCPGRLARRANVEFHATAAEAEAAGFRACKRCKPNMSFEDPQESVVVKACMLIEEAAVEDISKTFRLDNLARKVGLTSRYFHKVFKNRMGVTPKEYARQIQCRQSSSSATPKSSTSTENNLPRWDFDTFDFNDLIDYGIDFDNDPMTADTHAKSGMLTNPALDNGGIDEINNIAQAWATSSEPSGTPPMYAIADDWLLDHLALQQSDASLNDNKSTLTVSTFELDATALLDCDNVTSLVHM